LGGRRSIGFAILTIKSGTQDVQAYGTATNTILNGDTQIVEVGATAAGAPSVPMARMQAASPRRLRRGSSF
jgi:autotransporter passenger strand-loop-strand repeat protein